MNQRLTTLTHTLDKVITNVDAIGKTIGEMRPKEIAESKEVLASVNENLRRLDKFVYTLKQDIDIFKDGQLYDNESIEEALNAVVKILTEMDQETKLSPVELTNVEPEEPLPAKKRGRQRAHQQATAPQRRVKFQQREREPPPPDEDDDDVESKIRRMRQRRGY